MPAYLIARSRVTNPESEALAEYRAANAELIERHGGRYLVRGGPIDLLEGDAGAERFVVIEFPDATAARGWYDSPEYRAIRGKRQSASDDDMVVVEGV